jgi:hypothetical protein
MRLNKDYLPGSSGSVGARVSKGLLVSPIGPPILLGLPAESLCICRTVTKELLPQQQVYQ